MQGLHAMRSQAWFEAYEAAYDRLEGAGAPAALIGEAAAELANVSLLSALYDRADEVRLSDFDRRVRNARSVAEVEALTQPTALRERRGSAETA